MNDGNSLTPTSSTSESGTNPSLNPNPASGVTPETPEAANAGEPNRPKGTSAAASLLRMEFLGKELLHNLANIIPFIALISVTIGMGLLFYQVIQPLLIPLFAAAITALLLHPLQLRLTRWLGGARYGASSIITLVVLLLIIIPMCLGLYIAWIQLANTVQTSRTWLENHQEEFHALFNPKPTADPMSNGAVEPNPNGPVTPAAPATNLNPSPDPNDEPSASEPAASLTEPVNPTRLVEPTSNTPPAEGNNKFVLTGVQEIDEFLTPERLRSAAIEAVKQISSLLVRQTGEFLGRIVNVLVGLALFGIAFFFFLADGEAIVKAWEDITPMEPEHDAVIRREFTAVCRGVIWGTFLAAMVQGLLFFLGLMVIDRIFPAGLSKWAVLIGLLTVIGGMIPFVGAFGVWGLTAITLIYYGHWQAAICVVVYGASIVSTVDNLVKIIAIGDTAKMHPLLVAVCVLGGLQVLGLLGLVLGPAVGAVLFALLRVLKRELEGYQKSAKIITATS